MYEDIDHNLVWRLRHTRMVIRVEVTASPSPQPCYLMEMETYNELRDKIGLMRSANEKGSFLGRDGLMQIDPETH